MSRPKMAERVGGQVPDGRLELVRTEAAVVDATGSGSQAAHVDGEGSRVLTWVGTDQ